MSNSLLWKTLIVQLKASPAKAAVLGVLALVLVAVVAGQWLGGPRSVEAALATVSIPIPGKAGLPVPDSRTESARQRTPRPPLPALSDIPVRDLFETDWSGFAPVTTPLVSTATAEASSRADAAPRLVLELTLTGPAYGGRPFAMINGTRVTAGDTISRFKVDSIAPGTVILTADDGEQIVLHMD